MSTPTEETTTTVYVEEPRSFACSLKRKRIPRIFRAKRKQFRRRVSPALILSLSFVTGRTKRIPRKRLRATLV